MEINPSAKPKTCQVYDCKSLKPCINCDECGKLACEECYSVMGVLGNVCADCLPHLDK
jgi:hypothetical protein